MKILKEAIRNHKQGNYHRAIELYERAGDIYGFHVVKANIYLCKKSLSFRGGDGGGVPGIFEERRGSKHKGDKRSVLLDAFKISQNGDHEEGIRYAEKNLPEELLYTVNTLRANAAIERGDEVEWIKYLNAYLSCFGVTPITLRPGDTLLSRLSTCSLPLVDSGPLVTVIMPAWNAESTVESAVHSILNQTWKNLELVIVDDASEDSTWEILSNISGADDRVRLVRNKINVGPYVSKNMALMRARGKYVTGHDADDWAHPQRLENHMNFILGSDESVRASLTYMIRMTDKGYFDTFSKINDFTIDGVTRTASISCLFDRQFLSERLGFWDSVRFGADSEMIARAQRVLGREFVRIKQVGMLCLSTDNSLTNHPEFGIKTDEGGLSKVRSDYKKSWMNWHEKEAVDSLYIPFPVRRRLFEAPEQCLVVPPSVDGDEERNWRNGDAC